MSANTINYAKDRGHLRIDQEYSSSLDNRTIAYCHGTEYFIKGANQQMIVHYYFDGWGYLTQISCKYNGRPFPTNPDQMAILIKRATDYSDAISELLNKKQERFLKLVAAIEAITQKIRGIFNAEQRDLKIIKTMLEQRASMMQQRAALCDEEQIANEQDSLNLYLQTLTGHTQVSQRTAQAETAKVATEEDASESQPETEPVATELARPQVTVTPRKSKETKRQDRAHRLEPLISKLKSLQSISQTLNANAPAANLATYLQEMTALRVQILCAEYDAELNKGLDSLKTEIQLFIDALSQGNLEYVKVLFPYCANQVTIVIYNRAVYQWIGDARNGDKKLFAGRLEVYNYLHEKCSIFNTYIRIYSMSQIHDEDTFSYTMMYLAYLTGSETLFSALLSYGANPHMFWKMDKNGEYKMPMQVIIEDQHDTGFYVEELIRYGVEIKKDPKMKIVTAAQLEKYKNRISPAQYRVLHGAIRETRALAARSHGAGAMSRTTPQQVKDQAGEYIIQCHFLNFVFASYFADVPKLFSALLNHSSLDSLLIALAHASNSQQITYLWITNALSGNLLCAPAGPECDRQNLSMQGFHLINSPNCVSLLFQFSGAESLDLRRTRLLVAAINRKLQNITAEQIYETESQIRIYMQKLAALNSQELSRELYTALNILAIAGGSLNEARQIKLVENFAQIAIDSIKFADEIKRAADTQLRAALARSERLPRDLVTKFQTARQGKYSVAMNNLYYALNAAFFTTHPNIRKLPIVEECFQQATALLKDDSKLEAETKHFWLGHFRSRSDMEALLLDNKNWLAAKLS